MTNITILNAEHITVEYYLEVQQFNYTLTSSNLDILTQLSKILGDVGIIGSEGNKHLVNNKYYILTYANIIKLAKEQDEKLTNFFYKVIASMLNVSIANIIMVDSVFKFYYDYQIDTDTTMIDMLYSLLKKYLKLEITCDSHLSTKCIVMTEDQLNIICKQLNTILQNEFIEKLTYLGIVCTYKQPNILTHRILQNTDLRWFEQYFGENEKNISKDKNKLKFHIDTQNLCYEPQKSKIIMKNISYVINDVLYKVGNFYCLSKTELRKELNTYTPYTNDSDVKLTYKEMTGDSSILLFDGTIKQDDVVQAASQFNLLEMVNVKTRPEDGISIYTKNPTQGPIVAESSPAGTFFRNYLIYNGKPQTAETQINTLSEALEHLNISKSEARTTPDVNTYSYLNGYLFVNTNNADTINKGNIQEIMDKYLRVGVHMNTPSAYRNTTFTQVYTSSLHQLSVLGPYNEKLSTAILTSAFKCTLEVAVSKISTNMPRVTVYLTDVGCGYLGNKKEWGQNALINALVEYRQYPLDVIMITYYDIKLPFDYTPEFSEETINKLWVNLPKLDPYLIQRLREFHNKNPGKKVVLLSTGAYNPAHKTHIRMGKKALEVCNNDDKFIEKFGNIVAVILSPSHDKYVKSKGEYLPSNDRLQILKLSIQEENETTYAPLFTDDWEMNVNMDDDENKKKYNHYPDFPNVYMHFVSELEKMGYTVMYLCGGDHFYRNVMSTKILSVVLNRKSDKIEEKDIYDYLIKYQKEPIKTSYIITINNNSDDYQDNASSTQVRIAIEQNNSKLLCTLLYKNVIKYMGEKKLFETYKGYKMQQEYNKDEINCDKLHGGYKNKYLKYKQKYIKLKYNIK